MLKHGDGFGVFDGRGDVRPAPGGAQGVYYQDTRHLSGFTLTIDGEATLLLSSILRDDNATLTCDLTNPDFYDEQGKVELPHDLIHLRRSRFLWKSGCFERINVRNFDDRPRRVEIAVEFEADFADLFEVRGFHRAAARRPSRAASRRRLGRPELHRPRQAAARRPRCISIRPRRR